MPVALERVTYTYQAGAPWAVTALEDVSLTIQDGEAVGLIGPTGSGKSTLVQHLAGLLKPTSGRVLIDGRDLWAAGADRRALRQRIGLVFQYPEHQLFEETVRADIAYGPRNLGLSSQEVERRVLRALRRVGLDDSILDRSPFELSGGQMRRVAIAGVLAMEPRVLILDEPTAGLDPRGRDEILGFVADLHRREGLTVVIVSHHMDEVARLARRVVVMDGGRIVLDGPTAAVYARVEELERLHLEAPLAARLAARLAQRGWPIARDLLDIEAVADAVARCLGSGGRDAAVGDAPGV
ncbi:MAG: energy-coupling factor transporter ATPase [Thermaerobacter sp.]|nr:energy-coupling factor transporter ATPase [Bacillota bacterium]